MDNKGKYNKFGRLRKNLMGKRGSGISEFKITDAHRAEIENEMLDLENLQKILKEEKEMEIKYNIKNVVYNPSVDSFKTMQIKEKIILSINFKVNQDRKIFFIIKKKSDDLYKTCIYENKTKHSSLKAYHNMDTEQLYISEVINVKLTPISQCYISNLIELKNMLFKIHIYGINGKNDDLKYISNYLKDKMESDPDIDFYYKELNQFQKRNKLGFYKPIG